MLSRIFTPPFQLTKICFANVPIKLLNSHLKKIKNLGYANITENIKGMFYFIILCKR